MLPSKDRPEHARQQIVNVEMHLRNHTDIVSGALIHRNDRLHTELE